ncbi:hypothetical protein SEEGA711_09182 [Salmonella enterica subsp. enterica serovar Gaminara str. ATCC BAA-711]|nr:hypothetical protein SEEGA711_09182 [Salmonella enterica subsp. enterica serovar Gaminara str. ATCC BAA-711]
MDGATGTDFCCATAASGAAAMSTETGSFLAGFKSDMAGTRCGVLISSCLMYEVAIVKVATPIRMSSISIR